MAPIRLFKSVVNYIRFGEWADVRRRPQTYEDWAEMVLGRVDTDAERDAVRASVTWRANRKRALCRSWVLFRRKVTPIQRQQYEQSGAFGVAGSRGGRFLIYGNGDVYGSDGHELTYYCYQPPVFLPVGDRLLALKWFIESDERSFRRRANPSLYGGPWAPYREDSSPSMGQIAEMIRRLTEEVLEERRTRPT